MPCKFCGNTSTNILMIQNPSGQIESVEICSVCFPKFVQYKMQEFENLGKSFPPVNTIPPESSNENIIVDNADFIKKITNTIKKSLSQSYFNSSQSKQENNLPDYYQEEKTPPCPKCGMSRIDFLNTGKPGCGHCYVHFPEMEDLVKATQEEETRHRGKLHKNYFLDKAKTCKISDLIKELEQEMAPYISREEYELAIPFRNSVREIKKLALDLQNLEKEISQLVKEENYELAQEIKNKKNEIQKQISNAYANPFLTQKNINKEFDLNAG